MKFSLTQLFPRFFRGPCSRRVLLQTSLVGMVSFLCKPAFASLTAGDIPEGRLSLYNIHTKESLNITYRNSSGKYVPEALNELDRFFRCHYTGQVKEMDIVTIESLNLVGKILGGNREIHVISGFRSPEYNNLLISEGRGVAKHSMHLLGKAIDFAIPQVALLKVRDVALSLGRGGVGYYPKSDFVHIDSGRVRYW